MTIFEDITGSGWYVYLGFEGCGNPLLIHHRQQVDYSPPLPNIKTVEKLKEIATAKLSEIVRRSVAGEAGWEGYDNAELIAARERTYIYQVLLSTL
jgi:hypothetical protein